MPPDERTHHHQSFAKEIKSRIDPNPTLIKPVDPAANLQEILKRKYIIINSNNQIVGSSVG